MAAEELLKEAERAKTRVEIGGSYEWAKKPKQVNKRFVVNTILQSESQNRRKAYNLNKP